MVLYRTWLLVTGRLVISVILLCSFESHSKKVFNLVSSSQKILFLHMQTTKTQISLGIHMDQHLYGNQG